MSEALERAAMALFEKQPGGDFDPSYWDDVLQEHERNTWREAAAVAVLAFLDTEGMERKIAYALMGGAPTPLAGVMAEDAQRVLSALRAEAGGDTKP